MTHWSGTFIAVDWGTTNRRAYAVTSDGGVSDWFEDERGVLSVPAGGFEAAVMEIRNRLGDWPMLFAGMIGSNRGWVEVPYVQAPTTIAELVAGLYYASDRMALVPGLCIAGGRFDIMRGEEVQALGAVAAGLVAGNALLCHPGTHAKWITMANGAIQDFRTAMTGEVFALLKSHSILQLQGEVGANGGFDEGVAMALQGEPLLDALFSVRSRVVLGALNPAHSAAYASGLLIGTDVAQHTDPGNAVTLLGRPELCALYSVALERQGCTVRAIDGADAFVAGMNAIRKLMI